MPKEGIFAKVLKGGTIKRGDTIKVVGSKGSKAGNARKARKVESSK